MRKVLLLLISNLIFIIALYAQSQQYKVAVVAFYNLENLYDTIDNPYVNDEEFLPTGPKNYNGNRYKDKLQKLSTVLSKIGADLSTDGAAIIGVAEVENGKVLNDLVQQPQLKNHNYKFVHYDSRDARGIDVALLYNPKYFKVETSNKIFVRLPEGTKDAYFTRDILWVKGKLDGETIHVYVNHWPSRRGSEERSAPARTAAAQICKNHADSIRNIEPNAKIIIMGDLNDDPVSPSITQILQAKGKIKDVKEKDLFNPWIEMYKQGVGTLAYQDAWGLFDQIIISDTWLPKQQSGFFYYKALTFNKEFLIENTGKYKGYPMRTWDGNTYRGGYSDHLPTFIVILKPLSSAIIK